MDKKKWKIIAIIFIVLFISETLFLGIGVYLVEKEEKMTMECYYDICADYPQAQLEEGELCSCYDYDLIGNMVVAKQEYMG